MKEKPLSGSIGPEIRITQVKPCLIVGKETKITQNLPVSEGTLEVKRGKKYVEYWEEWERAEDKRFLEAMIDFRFVLAKVRRSNGERLFFLKFLREPR